MTRYIKEISPKIDAALKKGQGVLVHCRMGVSRSATIVLSYLMKYFELRLADATELIHCVRNRVGSAHSGALSHLLGNRIIAQDVKPNMAFLQILENMNVELEKQKQCLLKL